jgi:hypothetical protein
MPLYAFVFEGNVLSLSFDRSTSIEEICYQLRALIRIQGPLLLHVGTRQLASSSTLALQNVSDDDIISVSVAASHISSASGAGSGSGGSGAGSGSGSTSRQLALDSRKRRFGSFPAAPPAPTISPDIYSSLTFDTLPRGYTPEQLYAILKVNSSMLNEIKRDKDLYNAAIQTTPQALKTLLQLRYLEKLMPEVQRETALATLDARLASNPFDEEAQKLLLDEIQRKNVQENYENAFEYMPEAFGSVDMLYVRAMVNGVEMKAFVDSGAQMTIMSQRCASKCGLLRLMDTKFSGIAKGVGTSKILGRVHMADLRVAGVNLPCTFTILEQDDMDFLLGLDMLKRFQACIDLNKKKLTLSAGGIVVETPFLEGSDLPGKSPRSDEQNEDEKMTGGEKSSSISSSSTSTSMATSARLPQKEGTEKGTEMITIDDDIDDTQLYDTLSTTVTARPPPLPPQSQSVIPSTLAAGSSISTTVTTSTSTVFPEASIAMLMSMGFSKQKVIEALTLSSGDIETAASLLPDL